MRTLIATLLLFGLSACATNSGVVTMGDGSYFVSRQAASSFSGMGNLRAQAMQDAAARCGADHKAVQIVSDRQSEPPYIMGNFPRIDLTFRCEPEHS